MSNIKAQEMPALPSYTRYYWAAWIAALCVYLLSSLIFPLRCGLGWFAFFAGLGSVYVFHFEFGRLMGFLKVHSPSHYDELQHKVLFEALAFIHPALIRKLWQRRASRTRIAVHEGAFLVYRSAWLFSLFSLVFVMVLANTVR